MKKLDEIVKFLSVIGMFLSVVVMFAVATFLTYDSIFEHCSLGKRLFNTKIVEVVNQKVNEPSVDTIASISSYKKAQGNKFSELIMSLKENPDFFSRIKVDLSNGSDPYDMEKPPVTVELLSKWNSFDFIYLEFPDGLSIHCDNYSKDNPEFFAKITTVRETSYGFSQISIPYYMAKTGKESVSEIEEQKYVLEAIEYIISTINKSIKVLPRKCYSCKK